MAKPKIPTLANVMKAGRIGLAIFGGRELTHAAQIYIYDAQTFYGELVVESALDGRNLFVPVKPFETDDRDTWS